MDKLHLRDLMVVITLTAVAVVYQILFTLPIIEQYGLEVPQIIKFHSFEMLIVVVVLAPIVEEICFRLFPLLIANGRERKSSVVGIAIASSVIFTLGHGLLWSVLIAIMPFSLLLFSVGWWYSKKDLWRRAVIVCVAIHGLNNLALTLYIAHT